MTIRRGERKSRGARSAGQPMVRAGGAGLYRGTDRARARRARCTRSICGCGHPEIRADRGFAGGFPALPRGDAWTWERMALTRARVGGPAEMRRRVNQAIEAAIWRPIAAAAIRRDATPMRGRMERELRRMGRGT